MDRGAAVALIMCQMTLGVRRRAVERHVCERAVVCVQTPLGTAPVKRKRWRGEDLGAAPEYEDCARLAREHGVALREVYRMVVERVIGVKYAKLLWGASSFTEGFLMQHNMSDVEYHRGAFRP